MGLQTNDLVAVGISSWNELPPNAIQPKLADGIHLRWAFSRAHGLPWYGTYLFRRHHDAADRQRRRADIAGIAIHGGAVSASTTDGTWSSDSTLRLTSFTGPAGALTGLDLSGRMFLRLQLPDRASQLTVRLGFLQQGTIEVTAYLQQVAMSTARVKGQAGQSQLVTLASDSISAIELGGGPAVLLELDVLPVASGALQGWQAVSSCPYPICLPVAHPSYPCAGAPTTLADAEKLALIRIHYGPTGGWSGANFASLHGELVKLVDGGPAGLPMADRFTANVPSSLPGGPDKMSRQYPLDLVLLASLHPAVAQMVGLYWIDNNVASGVTYDYLVLGAFRSSLGATAADALQWLNQNGFDEVDAYIVFDKSPNQSSPPLAAPTGLKVYALPGIPVVSQGAVPANANHVGLRWDVGRTKGGALKPDAAVMYHVWRAGLGNQANPTIPASGDYLPISTARPVVVVDVESPVTQATGPTSTWPPDRIYYADASLPDGWYGYQVNGVDIFGRHSVNGAAGPWLQWNPGPTPKPWYFKDPSPPDLLVHASAIRLRDAAPPPAPTGVEAYALDPLDPLVVKDAAYQAWWTALTAAPWYQALNQAQKNGLIGLRVRWRWTASHMELAPDTREFRIYFHDRPMNVVRGRIVASTAASATETDVVTDIANSQPADAYKDLRLSLGKDAFRVVSSQAGTPLTLRLKNIGPVNDVKPPANVPCLIVIPPDHPPLPYTDYQAAASWLRRYHVVTYNDATCWRAEPPGTEHAGRVYEVFLPIPAGAANAGVPLATTLDDPIKYAWIGVSAADDKTYEPDRTLAGPWGNRYGNEGAVGDPSTIFRVRREPPPPPQLPPADSDKVFATPADYHNRSFYTFRWIPEIDANGKPLPVGCHVFRALDDSVFGVDWERAPATRLTLDPTANSQHRMLFPPAAAEPRWDAQKCQQVAAELNALNTLKANAADLDTALAAYGALSNDALRVLAGLPGNEAAFSQQTIKALDPTGPECADRRGPDSPDNYAANAAWRSYTDTLVGTSSNRYFYRGGAVDGAQNHSITLSPSSPPVYCPDVVPPRTPSLTRVFAGDANTALPGDGKITLVWASNREPDLKEYRVYRADDKEAARDIRLMTLVQTLAVSLPPSQRSAEVAWTDAPVQALKTFYYRIAAVDVSGNASRPSAAVPGRAYDEALPVVPPLTAVWTAAAPPAGVRLDWVAVEESLLEMRPANLAIWQPATTWLGSGTHSSNLDLDEKRAWRFRLRVRKATGAVALGQPVSLSPLV